MKSHYGIREALELEADRIANKCPCKNLVGEGPLSAQELRALPPRIRDSVLRLASALYVAEKRIEDLEKKING